LPDLHGRRTMSPSIIRSVWRTTPAIAEYVAHRTGRRLTDFEVQVTWGAVYGGLLGVLRHWHATGYAYPLGELLDRTLTSLRSGLELHWRRHPRLRKTYSAYRNPRGSACGSRRCCLPTRPAGTSGRSCGRPA
jgi:hypothetical protein